jgi:hypothetical protein
MGEQVASNHANTLETPPAVALPPQPDPQATPPPEPKQAPAVPTGDLDCKDFATKVEAHLEDTNLEGANLSGANLEGATEVTGEELEEQARSLEAATMPDGTEHD